MYRYVMAVLLLILTGLLYAQTGASLVQEMLSRGHVYTAEDRDIGRVLDRRDHHELYESVEGFFSPDRDHYVDPALREALSRIPSMQEEIVEVRIGPASESRNLREHPVKLFTFSGQKTVDRLVVRRSDGAPRGWFVLDAGNFFSE